MEDMTPKRPKLIFFVSVDWFFFSHFFQRAMAAKEAGYDVVLVSKFDQHEAVIRDAGIRTISLNFERRSLSPIDAVQMVAQVASIYRREQPAIIHHVAIKPILIGGLASLFARRCSIVNAIVGMGYVFTGDSLKARLIRPVVRLGFKFLLNPAASKVVFENRDDLREFVEAGAVRPEDAVLIRGAGVEPAHYQLSADRAMPPVTIFVARLLWDKGLGEFMQALRILKQRGVQGRFLVVGDADADNPACVDSDTIDQWKNEGLAEFLGYRSDVAALLAQSDIACLPSHREGLPKALLEAMATGLPCITTDTPGCREVVRHMDNGLLVPSRAPSELAGALELLLGDSGLRRQMGARGRQRVEEEFCTRIIVRQTLELYAALHSAAENAFAHQRR